MPTRSLCLLLAAGLAAISVSASFVADARADVRSISVKSVTPADGATIPPSSTITFQVKTDDPVSLAKVEVATQPTLGQDGTLAQEFTVPWGLIVSMTRGDAFPDTYTGTAYLFGQASYAGTYYWQMSYTRSESLPAPPYVQTSTYTTPVYRLVIQPPPTTTPPTTTTPPPTPTPNQSMTLAQANGYVPRIIRRETRHNAYNLKRTCKRQASAAFDCSISWGTTRRLRSNSVIYAGTLSLEDEGESIGYSFEGLRATESCIRRKSVKRCARSVRW